MTGQVKANTDKVAGNLLWTCLHAQSSLTPTGLQALTMVVCSMEMLTSTKMSEQGTVMVPGSKYFHFCQCPVALHGVISC